MFRVVFWMILFLSHALVELVDSPKYAEETILNSKGIRKRSCYVADRLEYLSSDRNWEVTENLTNGRGKCICGYMA